jgi:hypothetical protein
MQLFWPDDKRWYLVEIHSIIPKLRTAKCATWLLSFLLSCPSVGKSNHSKWVYEAT